LLIANKRFAYHPTNGAVYRQWSTQTVCRRDISEVHRRRLQIEQCLEDHLRATKQLTRERLRAINQARFQIARTAWGYDAAFAGNIVDGVQKLDPTFSPKGDAAPVLYRGFFHLLGFRRAERLASVARRLHISPFSNSDIDKD